MWWMWTGLALASSRSVDAMPLAAALRPPDVLGAEDSRASLEVLGEEVWSQYVDIERATLQQLDTLAGSGGAAGKEATRLLEDSRSTVDFSVLQRSARRELQPTVRQVRR